MVVCVVVVKSGDVGFWPPIVCAGQVVQCHQPIGAVFWRCVKNNASLPIWCCDHIANVIACVLNRKGLDGPDTDIIFSNVIPFWIVTHRSCLADDDGMGSRPLGRGPVPPRMVVNEHLSVDGSKRGIDFVNVRYQPPQLSCGGQIPSVVKINAPSGRIPVGTMGASNDIRVVVAVKVIDGLSRILEVL